MDSVTQVSRRRVNEVECIVIKTADIESVFEHHNSKSAGVQIAFLQKEVLALRHELRECRRNVRK